MAWYSFSEHSTEQRRRIRTLLLAVGAVLVAVLLFAMYKTYEVYQTELPSFEQLHSIEPSLSTRVYDRNGQLLKEFFSENRSLTPYRDMPKPLVDMLLATEDQEYYDHWGINVRRVGMVALNNLLHLEIKAGASTVTQQLSRMLFLNQEQTLERKIKEALTAIKLERTYSKDEILEMYLNQYYFSRGAYGISAAARTFFNKRPSEMNINECAMVIGLLRGPNINSPFNNPDKALRARNRVLFSYFRQGGIDREQFDVLKNEPIIVSPPVETQGIAPYFTETIRQYLLERYGEDILYTGGLEVYTSLDAGLQSSAELAVAKKIDSLRAAINRKYGNTNPRYTKQVIDTLTGEAIRVPKLVQGAFVAIDNENGDVIAMVGGRSFAKSEFNRAVQALRQPGSAFKPFVYTAAIDNGYKPTDLVDDNPIVLTIPGSGEWRPNNYDSKFLGPITLRDALRQSRNLASIRLLLDVGAEQVIFYAQKMGITAHLEPVPSLAVGVSEVRLVELVSAISTFPNKGIHIPYRMVHRVVDRYGKVLEDNTSIRKEEALSSQTAYIMTSLMESVVNAGTAAGARRRGFTRPAGGKTGTSDDFCDNWFIGFTPQISAGVWIGFDDKTSLGQSEDGGTNAVPVWTEFMLAAHDSLPAAGFEEPEGIVHLEICAESGQLASYRCPRVLSEVFRADNQPTESCALHSSRGYRLGTDREFRDRPRSGDRSRF